MSDIETLRNKIDATTLEMIRLLKDRTDTVRQIGEIKKNTGMQVTDRQRENSLRRSVVELCGIIGLDESIATKFLNFLINESIKVQSAKQTHLSMFHRAKALEAQGKKIIHMEIGEPDFMPPPDARRALGEACEKGFTKYGPAGGLPQLRCALAQYASEKFHPGIEQDNILVSPGARFCVFLAITTLLNPGDEIIIIDPSWPAYKDCAINAGIKVQSIGTTLEGKWEPDIGEIKDAINANTRMIVLNYPNNPTGKILNADIQDGIMSLARRNDLYVLSDEIYSEYSFKDWNSVLKYGYDKSIITQSFSKSHAMTGFRIGYAIAKRDVIDRMVRLQALCLTSVAEPIQYSAIEALGADISANSGTIQKRLKMLSSMAEGLGLEFARPDGAMYLFARAKKCPDGVRMANSLLEHGLAVVSGEGFGEYRDFIRISACQDEKKLMEGMGILGDVLGGK